MSADKKVNKLEDSVGSEKCLKGSPNNLQITHILAYKNL